MRRALFILGLLIDDDVDWICSAGERLTVPGGSILIDEGSRVDAIYLIAEGEFSVVVGGDGKEIARIGPGEIIGEVSLVDSRPATASVTALENSTVLRLPREAIEARLSSNPGFGLRFFRALAAFLAHRYRGLIVGFGHASLEDAEDLEAEVEDTDELDPDAFDRVSLAAGRFRWILDRINRMNPSA